MKHVIYQERLVGLSGKSTWFHITEDGGFRTLYIDGKQALTEEPEASSEGLAVVVGIILSFAIFVAMVLLNKFL